MVDLNLIQTLISPIIVIACVTLGYLIKTSKNKILNSFIPIILALTGALCNVWYTGNLEFQIILGGAISGLAATGVYEGFTNMLNLPTTIAMQAIEIPYGESIEDDVEDGKSKGKHSA